MSMCIGKNVYVTSIFAMIIMMNDELMTYTTYSYVIQSTCLNWLVSKWEGK